MAIYANKLLVWSIFREKAECGGAEVYLDETFHSIDECAKACNGISSMFAFGTNDFGNDRCWSNGCACLCETAANDDGNCDVVGNTGYRLYKRLSLSSGNYKFLILLYSVVCVNIKIYFIKRAF